MAVVANLRVYKLSDISIDEKEKNALLGLYAFTGNDFVSSFFGVGKTTAYEKMVTETQNLDLFSGLGQSLNQNTLECQLERAESFVCQIYREKQHTSVNEARYELFKRKLIKNKTVSLSRIPPCKSVLRLHLQRSAYVAYLWRRSEQNQIDLPSIDAYGWFLDGNIVWTEGEIFPTTVAKYIESEEEFIYEDENDDIYSEDEFDSRYNKNIVHQQHDQQHQHCIQSTSCPHHQIWLRVTLELLHRGGAPPSLIGGSHHQHGGSPSPPSLSSRHIYKHNR